MVKHLVVYVSLWSPRPSAAQQKDIDVMVSREEEVLPLEETVGDSD